MIVAINVLTGIMIFASLLLVGIVLLQEDKSGGGIGMIGGSSQSFFGASSANLLTRITTVLVVIFFVMSIVIGTLSAESTKRATLTEEAIFRDRFGTDDVTSAVKSKTIDIAPETIIAGDFENLILAKFEDETLKNEILSYYEMNSNGLHYNLTATGVSNRERVIELLNKVEFSIEAKKTIITQ
jgi:preprotein translocase subunit SecG